MDFQLERDAVKSMKSTYGNGKKCHIAMLPIST